MDVASTKILLIEDEPSVRASLGDNLAYEGYTVVACENGSSGLEAFKTEKPDLVILDVMMPGMDGLEVCKQIRALTGFTPIIMLTARASVIDKVVGLELGADDYLPKPVEIPELCARIKAMLRRIKAPSATNGSAQAAEAREVLTFGDVTIDFKSYRARRGEEELELSAKEFELLRYLASQPDIPVTRDELLDRVWGYNSYPTTRTVDNFIARLRQKVELSPERPQHLITIHGVGYKFVA